MQTNLFVIVIWPLGSGDPQVVSTFLLEGKPVFCSGSCMLDRARFFKSFDEAHRFNVDKILPLIDTKYFVSYVHRCEVTLNY